MLLIWRYLLTWNSKLCCIVSYNLKLPYDWRVVAWICLYDYQGMVEYVKLNSQIKYNMLIYSQWKVNCAILMGKKKEKSFISYFLTALAKLLVFYCKTNKLYTVCPSWPQSMNLHTSGVLMVTNTVNMNMFIESRNYTLIQPFSEPTGNKVPTKQVLPYFCCKHTESN